MPKRLLLVPMLAMMAACTSSSPEPRQAEPAAHPTPQSVKTAPASPAEQQRLVSALAERCRDRVAGHQNAAVTSQTSAVRMRADWVQVDGTMEWRGEEGVLRNAWTCDMFRAEDGTWYNQYMSFGPVT
ncbi:hypothetical protein [Longimicrobium sp.]|uniref:hypothetical protein n=1 Tax=Longimicrobium sp. TaxID=2029185 RepID=UPI002E36F591|nr:hypothetical protein [Longimicrobium sp.]HEX6041761.1 hypothetical protein [Longimicrobium sp.]